MGWITKLTSLFTGGLSGVYIYAILFAAGVGSGLYMGHIWNGYQENAAKNEMAVEAIRIERINESVSVEHETRVQTLQANFLNLEKEYEKLKAKKNIVTYDCKLTADAVRLWDESSNQGVSEDSKATPSEASKATDTTAGVTATIEQAVSNKLEWDYYCHQLEEKLDAIIKWDEEI